MSSIAQTFDERLTRYRDTKRYLWLVALTSPFIPAASIALYFATDRNPLCLLIPLLYMFVWIPIADGIFGEDTHNPPETAVPQLTRDNYYRTLLYVDLALLYANFLGAAWFVGTHDVPWWAFVAFALGVGISSADAILIGHELGHKQSKFDQMIAQLALGLVGYGHFRVEHNRGHHVHVATPSDCVSARMGESVYRFALREIPGALTRGWRLEKERLARLNRSAWSVHNEILMSWLLTALVGVTLVVIFGPIVLAFLLLHHVYAWFGLSQANYVEHYGLLRLKLPNGRYEPPEPRHSWNTNHVYSNLLSFHLQRHSDHHANALRPFQALRDLKDLPRLPSGYPGCFGLAAIPSLWFKVMDPKLMEWAGGDITKVNVDPKRRTELYARYGSNIERAPEA